MFCRKLLRLLALVVLIFRGMGDVAALAAAFSPGGDFSLRGAYARSSHDCLCKSCRGGMKCCCYPARTPTEATAMIAVCDDQTDAAQRILNSAPVLLPACGSLPLPPNFSTPLPRDAVVPPGNKPAPPDQPPRFL